MCGAAEKKDPSPQECRDLGSMRVRYEFWGNNFATNNLNQLTCSQLLKNIQGKTAMRSKFISHLQVWTSKQSWFLPVEKQERRPAYSVAMVGIWWSLVRAFSLLLSVVLLLFAIPRKGPRISMSFSPASMKIHEWLNWQTYLFWFHVYFIRTWSSVKVTGSQKTGIMWLFNNLFFF